MITDENTKIEILSQEEQELFEMFNIKLKKKHKKDKNKNLDCVKNIDDKIIETNIEVHNDLPSYTYVILLDRIYEELKNNDIYCTKKACLKSPIVHRLSSKKTAWINFKDCCLNINRDSTYVINYIINEISTEANLDGNNYLIFKGIYNQKNIEDLFKKFVLNYVQCSLCKSLETTCRRNSDLRINFLECNICKSTKSLKQITNNYKKLNKDNKS
jgi:translation initiation factor 2 subunit 2